MHSKSKHTHLLTKSLPNLTISSMNHPTTLSKTGLNYTSKNVSNRKYLEVNKNKKKIKGKLMYLINNMLMTEEKPTFGDEVRSKIK